GPEAVPRPQPRAASWTPPGGEQGSRGGRPVLWRATTGSPRGPVSSCESPVRRRPLLHHTSNSAVSPPKDQVVGLRAAGRDQEGRVRLDRRAGSVAEGIGHDRL